MRTSRNIEKFLGMTMENDVNGIKLHNQPLMERDLRLFRMKGCKLMVTPLSTKLDLATSNGEVFNNATTYRQLTGGLIAPSEYCATRRLLFCQLSGNIHA